MAVRSPLEPPPDPNRVPRHDPIAPPPQPEGGFADHSRSLARKFSHFWPRGLRGPPSLPWLGELVDRRKAWRWASQFPGHLARISAGDTAAIRSFVADTLMSVDPSETEGAGDKRCCRPRAPSPAPNPDPQDGSLPESTSCESESYYLCGGCPPGTGRLVEYVPVDGGCFKITRHLRAHLGLSRRGSCRTGGTICGHSDLK